MDVTLCAWARWNTGVYWACELFLHVLVWLIIGANRQVCGSYYRSWGFSVYTNNQIHHWTSYSWSSCNNELTWAGAKYKFTSGQTERNGAESMRVSVFALRPRHTPHLHPRHTQASTPSLMHTFFLRQFRGGGAGRAVTTCPPSAHQGADGCERKSGSSARIQNREDSKQKPGDDLMLQEPRCKNKAGSYEWMQDEGKRDEVWSKPRAVKGRSLAHLEYQNRTRALPRGRPYNLS